ncbi:hypothetical protein [Rosistilla oblonga]|uniref:hypothetical protein n=1 Tax=Rosistilla oblonga TaxID=2527990 RepID=UPI003A97AE3E
MSVRNFLSRCREPQVRATLGLERLEHRFPFDAAAVDAVAWGQGDTSISEYVSSANSADHSDDQFIASDADFKLRLDAPDGGIDSPETTVVGLRSPENSEADAAAFIDGSHMLAFAGEIAGNDGLFVSRTQPDGSPGDQPTAVALFSAGELQSAGSDIRVALATLDSGSSVVAWTDSSGIHLQQLDPSNALQGPRIDFATSTTSVEYAIDLIGLEDGGWMLAWNDVQAANIQLQRFDSEGQIVGQPNPIAATSTTARIGDLRLTEYPGADFGVSWVEWSTDSVEHLEQQYLGVLTVDGTWAIDPFEVTSDGFSPTQELAAMDDGRWVLAGMRQGSLESYPAVLVVDATGDLIAEHALDANAGVVDAPVALTKLAGGGFAIGYFRGESQSNSKLVVEQFNDDAEPVGGPVAMNHTALLGEPAAAIVGLANGGIAGYWIGTALDQTSPALLSRTVRMESTHMQFALEGAVSLAEADSIGIVGLPADAALNHGVRTSPTSWIVSAGDVDNLRILSLDPLPILTLTVDLHASDASAAPLASIALTSGTPLDDTIDQFSSAYIVDGRGGRDTFVVAGDRNEYFVVGAESGRAVRLVHKESGIEHLLTDVEYLAFDDLILELELSASADRELMLEADANDATKLSLETQAAMIQANSRLGPIRPALAAGARPDMPPAIRSMDAMQSAMNAAFAEMEAAMEMELKGAVQGMEKSIRKMNEPVRLVQNKQAAGEAKDQAAESKSKFDDAANSDPHAALAAGADVSGHAAAGDDKGITDPLAVPNFAPLQPARPALPQLTGLASLNNPVAAARNLYRVSGQSLPEVAPVLIPPAAPVPPPDTLAIAPVRMPFLNPMLDAPTAFDSQQLFAQIDAVEQQVAEDAEAIELVAGSAVVLATGMSIAQVAWLLRGSVLLTKLMSSIPIWVSFDPLPVLSESWNRVAMDSSGDSETLLDIARVQDPVGPLQ